MLNRPIAADTILTLNISAEDVNVIMAGLNELKMGIASPTMQRLQTQIAASLADPKEERDDAGDTDDPAAGGVA